MQMKVYRGTLVHCLKPEATDVLSDHAIGVQEDETGKILFVEPASKLAELALEYGFDLESVVTLTESQFIMPGLVDTHIHAPQYVNSGTGYDRQLLDWLQRYTFPTEASFQDVKVAQNVYPKAVRRTLLHGTTTASYFATIHLEATKELCRAIESLGQRALVGKVNMDQESPDYYVEETQVSVAETREFIKFVQDMKNPLIQPVVTPRFAPTCSSQLLSQLGELAKEFDVRVQSHICEQRPEVQYTLALFPDHEHCASIFEKSGLLTDKTYMAHCIYLEESELHLFSERGVGVAHCPNSNFWYSSKKLSKSVNSHEIRSIWIIRAVAIAQYDNLRSGILDVKRMLELGMKVGLGTDLSGGYSPSVFSAIRTSIDASKAVSFNRHDGYKTVSHHEALYMATLGGARVLCLDDKIGNFKVGKEFDALLIDVSPSNGVEITFDTFDQDSFDDVLMKFLYLGDDRNILKRFVAGKEVILM